MEDFQEQDFYNILKEYIEKVAMRKIVVKRDFDYLCMHILDRTGAYVSPITLRRFWEHGNGNYNVQPRRYTLDALARYTGHNSYECFMKSCITDEDVNSEFVFGEYLVTSTLKKGCCVYISWEPGHYIVAEYMGCEMFRIVESFKSKLNRGDTFQVNAITYGEPLYLNRLIHNGAPPCRYVCGVDNGVRFRIVDDSANMEME